MRLVDISYNEYFLLSEEQRKDYNFALKYNNTCVDPFAIGDITARSFKFVKDSQEFCSNEFTFVNYIEFISDNLQMEIEKVKENSIFALYQSLNYFVEQVKIVNRLESENLSHAPNDKEVEAGISVFSKYKSFPQFDNLARELRLTYEEVGKLDYNICYTKMLYDKERHEFNSNMMKQKQHG